MSIRVLSLAGLCMVLAACGTRTSDDAIDTGDDHLTSGFEVQVGGAGDAEIASAAELADQSVLATFHFPQGIAKFTKEGVRDPAFHSKAGGDVWRIFDTNDGYVLAPSEQPEKHTQGLDRISRIRTSDGELDAAFGTNGVVTFPKTNAVSNSTVSDETSAAAFTYDAARGKIDVLLVHDWQLIGGGAPYLSQPQAPANIEIVEVDAKTGASVSKGTHTFPTWVKPWTRSETREYEQVAFHGVYAQPDGAVLLVGSETVFMFVGPENTNYIATDWFTVRLVEGSPPTRSPIATTEYGGSLISAKHAADGSLDVILGGSIETISTGRDDKKIVRFSLDANGALKTSKVVVDQVPGVSSSGGFFSLSCGATTMRGDDFVLARTTDTGVTVTRYAPDGTKTEDAFAKPARCIRTIDFGASGAAYAGMWDTSGVGWRALLTKLTP